MKKTPDEALADCLRDFHRAETLRARKLRCEAGEIVCSDEDCEHPNIQYSPDEYDDEGRRISKHHWYCPDCDFLQVG